MKARILIVEDNALIAIDLAQALEAAGFEVMGPAMTSAQALALLKERGCNAAVVDINLRGETSEAVAVELSARRIPFVTMTGYALAQQPGAFDGVPAFAKPVAPQIIIDGLRRCLGPAYAAG
jgi:DNA-binding NtrC family response regulator